MIVPVLLSGGSGTRLWPLSRKTRPKQLLPMVGERSMLRVTIDRTAGLPELAPPILVCNLEHRTMANEDLRRAEHTRARLVLEPLGRNTAPAVAAAALVVEAAWEGDAVMLVLPADHVIRDEAEFRATVEKGLPHARSGALVTFGIVPTRAETGYGYIATGEPVPDGHRIDEFVEKPDLPTAERYVEGGSHLWNSGMFLFTAAAYLEELGAHAPEILAAVRDALGPDLSTPELVLDADAFAASPSTSIDYAVMEHTKHGVVIPLDAGWDDVGSWAALHEVSGKDDLGNVTVGDVELIDTTNSYVRGESRLVATVGLDRFFVVDTPDAVIVGPLDRSQDVKRVVERLADAGRSEAAAAATGVEPWGRWRRLDASAGDVLELVIEPGATAELGSHHEIVVLRGSVSTVAVESRVALDAGDVTAATRPRITNDGNEPAVLVVIDVQGEG
jgi:mannose-1-phosphate guanylyltransferase/mannose-6-phosphate isomerase